MQDFAIPGFLDFKNYPRRKTPTHFHTMEFSSAQSYISRCEYHYEIMTVKEFVHLIQNHADLQEL
jgi:hypothetical protein